MPTGEEHFSNPQAPPGEREVPVEETKPQRLTNADFRKLLLTPRAPPTSRKETTSTGTTDTASTRPEPVTPHQETKDDARATERKKKKSYYARIKKEEEEKMAELAEKYRDRAKERREGKNPDYQAEDPSQPGMGAYRAVAPDVKSGIDAAERRKQQIQESKFLGGDMEHTHLVKGLDYALLQKVRSEIQFKEAEIEPERPPPPPVETKEIKKPPPPQAPPPPPPSNSGKEEELTFKSGMGRRIFNSIFDSKIPEFNDLFLPGRMAYAMDLDDDDDEDIPTTVIRSKADLQGIESMQATFTTNDLVIQKLTQILSYLRTGRASKKGKKKDKGKDGGKLPEDSIYGDIGDYVPSLNKSSGEKDGDRDRDRDRGRGDRDRHDRGRDREKRDRDRGDRGKDEDKIKSYFDRSAHDEIRSENVSADARMRSAWNDLEGLSSMKDSNDPSQSSNQDDRSQKLMDSQQQQMLAKMAGSKHAKRIMDTKQYYTECYPGMAEMQDAIDDSDDEADYTKMDLGNKKGPVGRWDFDTQEEYSDYMNQREAMPKAAFQYGVKMADGRKTRRIGPNKEKDKNAELNREWQQIQQLLKRRKESEMTPGPDKRARYDYM